MLWDLKAEMASKQVLIDERILQLKVIETIEDLRRVLRGVINKTNRLAASMNKVYRPILQIV